MAIEQRDVNKNDLFIRPGMALEKVEKSGQGLGGEIRLAEEVEENWEEKGKLAEEEQKGVEVEEEESSSCSGSEEEEEEEEEEDSEEDEDEKRSSLSLLHLLTKNLAQVNIKALQWRVLSFQNPPVFR